MMANERVAVVSVDLPVGGVDHPTGRKRMHGNTHGSPKIDPEVHGAWLIIALKQRLRIDPPLLAVAANRPALWR